MKVNWLTTEVDLSCQFIKQENGIYCIPSQYSRHEVGLMHNSLNLKAMHVLGWNFEFDAEMVI